MQKLKHIFEYILFIIITNFLRIFSVDRSSTICSFVARKIGPLLSVTKIARNNLDQNLGKEIDTDSVIDGLWDNYGRYIGEFPFINEMSKGEVDEKIKILGLENIKDLQEKKQPFLMFLAHQANWDFMIRKITDLYPRFAIVYRKANNPYVDKKILSERSNENVKMIAKGTSGAISLIKAIKSGMSIAMLVDQKMNDGIEVPFFNRPAMTAHAIAKLALQYDYPIVPCQLIRCEGVNFKAIAHKPLTFANTGNNEKDCYEIMLKINKTLEGWIKEKPSQWFWFHNRWK